MILLAGDSDYFIVYIVGALISLVILGVTISIATESGKRNRLLVAQTKLLAEMAFKQGVSKDSIKTILVGTRVDELKKML